ncbi:NYN domain-containing protein [Priestia megaterium]|uniref:NYN domain-containing protein n=1 Tax=Priestia megaterium TaxID=1404 RepID=UPI000BF53DBA|nr:NYN domain-containing protein [Priestia megaterium]PEZ08331.1 NYN domain-containing protein [Priestia megaterium]
MERIMVFIDSNNFETAICELYGARKSVDYGLLTEFLAKKFEGRLGRYYYYIAQGDPRREQAKYQSNQRFIDTMNKKKKCIVRVGRLDYRGKDNEDKDIYVEKGVDVHIAIDMLTLAFHNAYDNAIILSADTDYIPVVEQVRQMGKNVTLCIPDKQVAGRMKAACDDWIVLNKEDLNPLLRK